MVDWTPDELQALLDKQEKVFLKLWKKGCGICKMSIPATDRLEAANTHGLSFGRINTDDYPEMLEISSCDALPAFFVFTDGKMKGKYTGFKGLDKLKAFVDEAVVS